MICVTLPYTQHKESSNMQSLEPTPIALSIAGSDPSGGAGIQCDIKTFMAHRVVGMAIPTMLTVQNTLSIQYIHPISSQLLEDQLTHLLSDTIPHVIKIGAVHDLEQATILHEHLARFPGDIVWDPVLISSSGQSLMKETDISSVVQLLSSMVTLATPNHLEQAYFSDSSCAVLTTNGEANNSPVITDTLHLCSGDVHHYTHPKYQTRNTHGTGCTLSSAIAANLAKGMILEHACGEGIRYCTHLLSTSNRYNLGSGNGSLAHEVTSFRFPR